MKQLKKNKPIMRLSQLSDLDYQLCSMNQCDWSGHIFYKKATLKGYHLYWGMLMRESASGLKRVDLYEEQAQSLVYSISVELADALSVKTTEGKGRHRYEFQIMATSGKHQFATGTEEECRKWIEKLNRILHGPPEPGVVYEFQIQVLPTSHSDKLALDGYYVMRVTDDMVMLYSSSGIFPTEFQCELAHITKVQCTYITSGGNNFPLLTIQTNSSAKIGEGGFAFSARSAADIATLIEHRRRPQPATKPQKISKPQVTDSEVPTRPHQRPLLAQQNRANQELREEQASKPLVTVPTRPHQRPLPSRQNRTSQELREEQVSKPLVTDLEVPTRHCQQPLPPQQTRTSQELREEHFKKLAPSLALLRTLQLPNRNDHKTDPEPSQNPKLQTAKPPVPQPQSAISFAPPAQKPPPSMKSGSPPSTPSNALPTSVKPSTSPKPPVNPKPPITLQQLCSSCPLPPSTSPRPNSVSLQARKSESSPSGDENLNPAPRPSLSTTVPKVLSRPLKDSKSQPTLSSIVPNNTDKRNSWTSVAQCSEEFENPKSWIIRKPLDLRNQPERSSQFVSSPPSQNSGIDKEDCSSLDKTEMSRLMESSTKPRPLSKEASYIHILPFQNQNTSDSKGTAVSPKVVRELPEGRVMQRHSTIRRAKSVESLHKSTDIPKEDRKQDSFELQPNPVYSMAEVDLTSSFTISPYATLQVETEDGSPYSIMYTDDGDMLFVDEDSIDSRPPARIPVVSEIAGDEPYIDCYRQSEDVSYDYVHRGAFYKVRKQKPAANIDIQRSGWVPSIPPVTEEGTSQSEMGKLPSLEKRPFPVPPHPPHPYMDRL